MSTFLVRINARNTRVPFGSFFLTIGLTCLCVCLFSSGCANTKEAPRDFESIGRLPTIFPSYQDVTAPLNIAPLNFDVCEQNFEQFVTIVSVAKSEGNVETTNAALKTVASFTGTKIRFPEKSWKKLLAESVGNSLIFSCYAKKESSWFKFDEWKIFVSADPIDPWISYRKIAPGYEYFSDLALWNRCLETFEERPFFRARLFNERTCVNCHAFQNYETDAFLFHMRITGGGTVFCVNGDVVKRELQAEGMPAGCSYPAWRPNSLHVAFASCLTMQAFHSKIDDRIDVLDAYSDIYLYDVAKNSLKPIVPATDDTLDTYPTWSPDGKTLYYCSTKNPGFTTKREETDARQKEAVVLREKLHYDVMKVSYDDKTGCFGVPEIVFAASEKDMSALFPRVSPDGKTMLVTTTRYGCFPIWRRDSDIWSIDLSTGEARNIEEINSSDEPDSYHSWSSSGRWVLFSSRRDDGSYTRLYITHFDADGSFSKPFMLPQRDPVETLTTMRSYNVPEFTLEPVKVPMRKILKGSRDLVPERAILEK